jgi:outer membrane cobalamin receptor
MKTTNLTLVAAGAALSLATGLATAQDKTVETVVVTGTRIPIEPLSIPSSVTVLDLKDIEARNDLSVIDLLRDIPGLQVTQPGGGGGVASVFLRGGEPNFTAVYVDGVKVNDPNNTRGGSFDFATMNLGDLERIELVRGPLSSVYGSDALTGAINLITRGRSDELTASIEGEMGTEDFNAAALSVAGPLQQRGGFSLRAARVDQGDYDANGTFESDSLSAKLVLDAGGAWRTSLHGRYADSKGAAFPEDSGGSQLAVLRTLDTKSAEDVVLGVDTQWRASERWALHALVNWYDHQDEFATAGVVPGVRDGVPPRGGIADLERGYGSLHAVATLGEHWHATIGADYQKEDGVTVGYVEFAPFFVLPTDFALERKTVGTFLELQYATDTVTLLASVRHDDPDSTDTETTAKAGVSYALPNGTTRLRANWGQGFKLPSFFALGNPLVGNPLLRPEKSRSFDAGVLQSFADGRVRAELTYFDTRFTDLIDFDFNLFTNVNRNVVTTQGLEVAVDYAVSDAVRAKLHLSNVDIEVRDSAVPLRQRPDWRGGVGLAWQLRDNIALNASWLYVGESFDSSIPTGSLTLPAYHRVDVNLAWSVSPKFRLNLAIDNLLDEGYAEAIGFTAPGIRPRLKMQYRF